MAKKPMTVVEMARLGGRARATKYTAEQLAEFSKNAGRPTKLDGRARRKLRAMLADGKTQAECAAALGVSTRTIGRAMLALVPAGSPKESRRVRTFL
jgi:hypothetical protein